MANFDPVRVVDPQVPEENGEAGGRPAIVRGGVRRQMVEHGEITGVARDLYRAQVGAALPVVVEVAPSGMGGRRLGHVATPPGTTWMPPPSATTSVR